MNKPTNAARQAADFPAAVGFRYYLAGRGMADRTITEYVRCMRRADLWMRENLGHPIEAADAGAVRLWSDTLPGTWSTRKLARSSLKQWQTWLNHPQDLAAAVRVPRKPKMRSRALEDHDAARLEVAAHQAGHRGFAVLLGLYLGMRCSEIGAAMWSGFDGRQWTWQRAKTGDIAQLPVPAPLAQAAELIPRYSPYVFPSTVRRKPGASPHVAEQTIWQWCRAIGASVGIDLSTHQLRHTNITRVVERMGIRVGQEWAGHRDPEVTAGYSRVPLARLTEAASLVDFGGTPAPPASNVVPLVPPAASPPSVHDHALDDRGGATAGDGGRP